MIPYFPHFTKLDLDHKVEIEQIVANFPPYSDFNFVSLFCWNTDGNTEVSRIGNGLVIKLKDYTSDDVTYSLIISGSDARRNLDIVLSHVNKLSLVPEYTILSLQNHDNLILSEEPYNHDYVYRVDRLARLDGSSYKKKRNKVHQFQNDLGEVVNTSFYTSLPDGIELDIEGLLVQWCFENDILYKDQSDEIAAIKTALANIEVFDLILTTLRVNGKLKGFSLNQKLLDGNAICHFEKTIKAHNNIGTYLVNKVANFLRDEGCAYVNWEQDLGLNGLRNLKQSYNTYFYLKKYSVAIAD